ncbi:winged helix-turn-helix domain-containing protein [Micromonospora sp. NPDC049081]|uniref:winged helix-turn-helix domain-containing protein n=1 Tax=Micromonospora sp. NPDC049081 TaxID=3155150 RepID=UPI0033DB2FFD
MVHPGQPRPSSQTLAALLRTQILTGQLKPGDPIPSDRWLQETHGVSRELVRRAIATLRAEGLIVVRQGHTSRVRQEPPRRPIDMTGVVRIETRMPLAPEREDMDIPPSDGVPILLVWRDGQDQPEKLPGDRWTIPGPAWPAR